MRSKNKEYESFRINYIVKSLNDPLSVLGKRLREDYNNGKPKEDHIKEASCEGCGGRNCHFDFKLILNSGKEVCVEEKGTCKTNAKLSKLEPWCNSVQSINIPLKKMKMFKNYGKLWFNFIKYLANEYELDISTLTLEEYLNKDFFHQGSVQTNEMKLLKSKFEEESGKKESIQQKYFTLIHEINKKFVNSINSEDLEILKNFIQSKIDKTYNSKDDWLQTIGIKFDQDKYNSTGETDFEKSLGNCQFGWSGKIHPPTIENIELDAKIKKNKKSKIAQLYIKYYINSTDSIDTKEKITTIRLRNKFANCSTDFK